jgi:putative ABC transport system permease protein
MVALISVVGSWFPVTPAMKAPAARMTWTRTTRMTGKPPDVPSLEYLGIVAAVIAIGWGSIMLPARLAMRSRPAGALGSRM